jgi:hypothetical protein
MSCPCRGLLPWSARETPSPPPCAHYKGPSVSCLARRRVGRQPAGIPNRSGQRTTAPRYPLASGVPTPTRATSRSRVTPLACSSPSPTLSGEFLAGIALAAPPLGPRERHCKATGDSQGFCAKTRVWLLAFKSSRGLDVIRIFTPFCVSAEPCKLD